LLRPPYHHQPKEDGSEELKNPSSDNHKMRWALRQLFA
jgi:hypothetical protein